MAIKYVPYYPEPIEGQALLDNFRRTLKYKGGDEIRDKLVRGMPLYEVERQEAFGDNIDGNLLIRGECVSACAYLKEQGTEVDLVYIDPPFASGADYAKKVYIRRNPQLAEKLEAAEQELPDEELRAFEEKMYGDVWDKEKYLNWMYENLHAINSVLSQNGSIFIHLDWHIVHYVKILMDEIFGEDNFINEIIWQRTDPHNDAVNRLGRTHDTIYWYSKTDTPLYNWKDVIEPLSTAALKEYSQIGRAHV
jgi:adenine-specific DNA-methyltransferase